MLVNLGVSILGILIFLFIFWKRLKDDYSSEIIFQTAFSVLVGVGLSLAFTQKYIPNAFFWTSTFGAVIGLGFASIKLKIRFYESLEALIVSLLPWLSLVFLQDSVIRSSLTSFIAFLTTLFVVFVSYWLDTHYKNFRWYKSGKIGFSGLVTAGVVSIVRAAIAISRTPVLSFVGKYEAIISGTIAFICFLLLFNLARNEK